MQESAPEERESVPSEPERPDWLVGADEAASAAPEAPQFLPISRAPTRNPGGDAARAPEKPKAWKAAASSIPALKLVSKDAAAADPFPSHETPDEEEDPATVFDAEEAAPAAPTRAAVVPLRESWWLVALDTVRSDRRIQILLLVLALSAAGFFTARPREDQRTPVSQIRRHPERFDGQTVTVEGRVGEVFEVGGSYAFYLHDGRDTLVVFTRSRTPEWRARIKVKGSISTGFLDGRPRAALFEQI